MTTLTASARRVNKPAPVRSTVVLFDAGDRRSVSSFGEGIHRSLPSYRVPFTAADAAWAAQTFGELGDQRDAEEFNRELEFRAAEAAALDRLTAGCLL
jgi:hypothetical protein